MVSSQVSIITFASEKNTASDGAQLNLNAMQISFRSVQVKILQLKQSNFVLK